MDDITQLLLEHGILQAHYRNAKEIVAEAIQEYVQTKGILLEKQVESTLRKLSSKDPLAFTDAQVERSSKPYYNQCIDKLGIKYMDLQGAILLTLKEEEPGYAKTIKYDRGISKRGYRKNLYKAIIFYESEEVLMQYVRERLSKPKLEYTFRVPKEMFIRSR